MSLRLVMWFLSWPFNWLVEEYDWRIKHKSYIMDFSPEFQKQIANIPEEDKLLILRKLEDLTHHPKTKGRPIV